MYQVCITIPTWPGSQFYIGSFSVSNSFVANMNFIFYFVSSVLVLAVSFKIYIKLFLTKYCKSKVCLVGKTVIITGANSDGQLHTSAACH
ncbi:unnamed protein product [Psylliodes chrysocephalus]|uniref:Uncharacterized protein n=1 Tax=Psylliodes chrysocephalus TaxID=3402493 RepID=A0A9P0CQ19_9CUCU|nr:unnamed protein product [Psylliodes chrysocephala]